MKKIVTVSLLSSCFALYSLAQPNTIRKLDGTVLPVAQLETTITRLMDTAKVMGMGVAILNGNKIVYERMFGYSNNDKKELLDTTTIFYGASFSKAVFAFLCMQLAQDGKLDLDKPLYQYLEKPIPEYEDYKDISGDDRWKLITARICLSHTTGFPNWRQFNPHDNNKLEIFFTPGSRYAYSGEGIVLLQLVIEKITGRNLDDIAQEKIFQPFGMFHTGYIWHQRFDSSRYAMGHDENGKTFFKKKRNKANAAGSLVTTLPDYARFIEAIMQGRGLEQKYKEVMISSQVKIRTEHQFPTLMYEPDNKNTDIDLSYGLGWGLFTCKFGKAFFKEGHDDGWRHYNINFPEKKISIIIMTNSANGESIFKELLEKSIGDTFTPWYWEGYVPYNYKK